MKRNKNVILILISIPFLLGFYFRSDLKSLFTYCNLSDEDISSEIYHKMKREQRFPKQTLLRDLVKKHLISLFTDTNDNSLKSDILFDLSFSFTVTKKDLQKLKENLENIYHEILYYYLYLTYFEEEEVLDEFVHIIEVKQSENASEIHKIERSIGSFFSTRALLNNKFYIPVFEQLICSSNPAFRENYIKTLYDLKGKERMEDEYKVLAASIMENDESGKGVDSLKLNKFKSYLSLKDNEWYSLSVDWIDY